MAQNDDHHGGSHVALQALLYYYWRSIKTPTLNKRILVSSVLSPPHPAHFVYILVLNKQNPEIWTLIKRFGQVSYRLSR